MENGRFWRRSLLDLFCRDEGLLSVARSSDNAESAGERARTSIKGHSGKRPSIVRGHFPKLSDCAHFHYETVDFGTLQLSLIDQQPEANDSAESLKDLRFLVKVDSQDREWLLRRSWEDFVILDSQLHQCIFDRRFSRLPDLSTISNPAADVEATTMDLAAYLSRLSEIADNKVNCGPVLTWIEIDNKGHRLLAIDESVINVPAIAAARAVKRHSAQTGDELSLEVGDFVSVIEMPPKHETSWWRGKQSFKVGFFPSDCVQLINEQRIPSNPSVRRKSDFDAGVLNAGTHSPPLALLARDQSLRSGLKRHSSLMGFLLTFLKSRPSRQRLKQQGILKERVFGCDLGEHLLNSGLDVPQVLQSCSEFVEVHGIVDGIYRLSGISSNVQKLRHEFDSGHKPDLTRVTYLQDIHCVGSLCKLYFRELPNPLLTFQLYPHFAEAVSEGSDSVRLLKVHKVIQQLPPPHYRTLHYLLHHLSTMASYSKMTGMHVRNLAIVWAPNLLRSREVEGEEISGTEAFLEVRVQSVVVEFLLTHAHTLFTECPTPQTEG